MRELPAYLGFRGLRLARSASRSHFPLAASRTALPEAGAMLKKEGNACEKNQRGEQRVGNRCEH